MVPSLWPCTFDLKRQTVPTEVIDYSYSWPELGRRMGVAIYNSSPHIVVGFAMRGAPIALRRLYRSGKFNARYLDLIQSDIPSEYVRARGNSDFAAAVACVSEACVAKAKREIPEMRGRIFRMYCPVPCPATPPEEVSGGRIRLAYLGIVRHDEKRVLNLIPVVSELLARKVDFELTIIGDGPERQQLERTLLVMPGAANRVHFLGMLPNSKALEVLSRQQVLLLLSDIEGQPLAMLEAMALGVVPVVSDLPGLREVIVSGENGFLAPATATKVFVSHIAYLAGDPEARARMAVAAWRKVSASNQLTTAVGGFAELLEIVCRFPLPQANSLSVDTYPDGAMSRYKIPHRIQRLKRRLLRQVVF